jgi:hypothetical protein
MYSPNNRYSTLNPGSLKAVAQLRSLSPSGGRSGGEKDTLIQRLIAQDGVTAMEQGLAEETYEIKSCASVFTGETAAGEKRSWADEVADAEEESGWEVVGVRMPVVTPRKEDDVFGPFQEEDIQDGLNVVSEEPAPDLYQQTAAEYYDSDRPETYQDAFVEEIDAQKNTEDIHAVLIAASEEVQYDWSGPEVTQQPTYEQELNDEPDADIVPPVVVGGENISVQQFGTTDAKKKRKRGKKGGKKIDKNKTTPTVSNEAFIEAVEQLSSEAIELPDITDVQDAEATVVPEDLQGLHPSDPYLDGAETVIEPSVFMYVAMTEVEDPVVEKMDAEGHEHSQHDLSSSAASTEVDDTAVEKSTDGVREDIQDTLSSQPLLAIKSIPSGPTPAVKMRYFKLEKKSKPTFICTSRNLFGVLDTCASATDAEDDVDDEETITPPSDFTYESPEPKKKSKARKRGKKGGKKVQKQASKKEDKLSKGNMVLAGTAAVLMAALVFAVAVLVK